MAASYDKFVALFAASGLVPQGLLAPWCAWSCTVVLAATDTVPTTVSSTVRVVCRVHNNSTDRRSDTAFAVSSSLANLDVLMLLVTDRSK